MTAADLVQIAAEAAAIERRTIDLEGLSTLDLISELVKRGARVWKNNHTLSLRTMRFNRAERETLKRLTPAHAMLRLQVAAKARRAEAAKDPEYLAWVRQQPCCVVSCGAYPPSHPHHAGVRGLGQKAPDATAIPLCGTCHRAYHDGKGPFGETRMTRTERQAWAKHEIERHRAIYMAARDAAEEEEKR